MTIQLTYIINFDMSKEQCSLLANGGRLQGVFFKSNYKEL
jgi:hypothetical protein